MVYSCCVYCALASIVLVASLHANAQAVCPGHSLKQNPPEAWGSAFMQTWITSYNKLVTVLLYKVSRYSISSTMSVGSTVGAYLLYGCPVRSNRIFSKFHPMSSFER